MFSDLYRSTAAAVMSLLVIVAEAGPTTTGDASSPTPFPEMTGGAAELMFPAASQVGGGRRANVAGDDGMDLGEAGRLMRLVDDAAGRQANPPPQRSSPRTTANTNNEGAVPVARQALERGADDGANRRDARSELLQEDRRDPAGPALARVESAERDHGDAARLLAEMASADQRNALREAIDFVKSALAHPVSWVVLVLVAACSLIFSAAARRGD